VDTKNPKIYESVKIAKLTRARKGKHHDLTAGVIRELKMLREGSALKIPLSNVGGVEMANLRSAIHRAATADKLNFQTQADEQNFYVWIDTRASTT
jgi:hypothetical protein